MNEHDARTIRFSLREMFGVTAIIALTMGIVSYTGSVAYGIHLSMCLIAWMMWRLLRGFPDALILILLGSDYLLWFAYERGVCGSDEDFLGYRWIIGFIASGLVLVGVWKLVRISNGRRRFWKYERAIAVATVPVLLVLWVLIIPVGSAAIARREASDIAANSQATAKAIAMVEEVRQRTGITPDEDALTELLGEPLPSVRWVRSTQQIRYKRTSDSTYQLSYWDMSDHLGMGDTVVYDSVKGWYREPW